MSKRMKRRVAPRRKISGGLTSGSVFICADNSGARVLRLIQVLGYKGRRRRLCIASVGDLIMVSCREGTPEMRRQMFNANLVFLATRFLSIWRLSGQTPHKRCSCFK